MVQRQLAMVIDINKCLGCHTCTIADKNMWLRDRGQEYMHWNNVECHPGGGYPKEWEKLGGGWKKTAPENQNNLAGSVEMQPAGSNTANKQLQLGKMPTMDQYGVPWKWDWEKMPHISPAPNPTWGSNWEEDVGEGDYPNTWYFYLARPCNHCTDPACLAACPRKAIYKRSEDGIVLIDQERCRGYRYCVRACPYKKPYFNLESKKSQKCIFCFPRLEDGTPPACVGQCPGRIRFFGYMDDKEGPVYKLVEEFKVAVPLHPEFGTEPNVYYIPPLSSPKVGSKGELHPPPRIPQEYLEELFGTEVGKVLERLKQEIEKSRSGQKSELVETLLSNHRWRI